MATTTTAVSAALVVAGAAPAGLTPAQHRAWERCEAARAAMAQLPPLDPDVLAGEAYYVRLARRNGDD